MVIRWRIVHSWRMWLAARFITLCKTFWTLMCNRAPLFFMLLQWAPSSPHNKHAGHAVEHLSSLLFTGPTTSLSLSTFICHDDMYGDWRVNTVAGYCFHAWTFYLMLFDVVIIVVDCVTWISPFRQTDTDTSTLCFSITPCFESVCCFRCSKLDATFSDPLCQTYVMIGLGNTVYRYCTISTYKTRYHDRFWVWFYCDMV